MQQHLKSPASPLFSQPLVQMKKNIKAPCHWPLCGEFTGIGEFPAQMASNMKNVSIWWRHHETDDMPLSDQIMTQVTDISMYHSAFMGWNVIYNKSAMGLFVHYTWCHLMTLYQMETFSALLALCAGNSPLTSEFPAQRPVTWSFQAFFDLRLE